MKKLIFLFLLMASAVISQAAYVKDMPIIRVQPNGDTLRCFVTGDEYYHRIHDAQGYTIVQNPSTGYYVYAVMLNGELTASNYAVGSISPASIGISPNLTISHKEWVKRQKAWEVPVQYAKPTMAKTGTSNHGTINNVAIFIRFFDDVEISTSLSSINSMFNDSTANASSMYNYFKHASYNQLYIPTYFYPAPSGSTVVSYQDSHPRSYYMPYDAISNTDGYSNSTERTNREFTLLENAVNYVNNNSPVPSTLNIDYDNDGYVDNICFIVKGTYTGWSDLLWPHKWSLYDRYVYINGKRVYTFNLQLEGSGDHYFSTSTFCHEMFHTLGAPDLYHYETNTNTLPVGNWDLMCSNSNPPQHSGAYMKYKYGNWIDSIPEITTSGTYTLHSLADSANINNCYKIASADPNQWYVLEYRDNSELFETALPGSGLLIYRIDTRFDGNADYDGESYFDEVYIFRPDAADASTPGNYSQAYFSAGSGRIAFTSSTNPHPWLTGNIIDTTISITNISVAGNTITFTYMDNHGASIPNGLQALQSTSSSVALSWQGNSNSYRVSYRPSGSDAIASTVHTSTNSCTLYNLTPEVQYEWAVRSLGLNADSSELSEWHLFYIRPCEVPEIDTIGTADTALSYSPISVYHLYSHSQQIITAAELGGKRTISGLRFYYNGDTPLLSKTQCTIYVARTAVSSFTSTSDARACSTMTKVYDGALNCVQGWNEFTFDTPFEYQGTGNLLIAIDDNSANKSILSGCTFNNSVTTDKMMLVYYDDTENPDPNDLSSFYGERRAVRFRTQIQLVGCVEGSLVNAISADTTRGFVEGSGYYPEGSTVVLTATAISPYHFTEWTDGNADNPRTITVTSDTMFVANFRTESIDSVSSKEAIITTKNRSITVSGANNEDVLIVDVLGRIISIEQSVVTCTVNVPVKGVYIVKVGMSKAVKVVVR